MENKKRYLFFHSISLVSLSTLFLAITIFLFVQHSHAGSLNQVPKKPPVSKRIVFAQKFISSTPTLTLTATFIPSPTIIPSPTVIPMLTVTPMPAADSTNDTVWERLAQCESGGNWSEDTGNSYFGGLQFNQSAWESVGGTGKPSDASKTEQIMRAKILQSRRGWGPWSGCSKQVGL